MKKNTAITHFKMFIIINLIIGLVQLQFASINAYADDSIGIVGVSESTDETDTETEKITSDSEDEMREQIEANYQECLKSDTWDRNCRKN